MLYQHRGHEPAWYEGVVLGQDDEDRAQGDDVHTAFYYWEESVGKPAVYAVMLSPERQVRRGDPTDELERWCIIGHWDDGKPPS